MENSTRYTKLMLIHSLTFSALNANLCTVQAL